MRYTHLHAFCATSIYNAMCIVRCFYLRHIAQQQAMKAGGNIYDTAEKWTASSSKKDKTETADELWQDC